MSIKDVDKALQQFLASDAPQAIALIGSWGRGKTFFWRRAIDKFSASGEQKRNYSYVSLFGASSLAELKSSVFDNAVSANDVKAGATLETWFRNAKTIAPDEPPNGLVGRLLDKAKRAPTLGRRSLSSLELLPRLRELAPLLRTVAFLNVRGYIVCFDDLERRKPDLDLKEVFGLISFLKEQRQCKVVAILNSDQLDNGRDAYDVLREKVFDFEICYAPTPAECAVIAFPKKQDYGEALARQCADRLGITNIRILQRVRVVIEKVMPYLDGCEEILTRSLVNSATLLTWCYNSKESGVPSYQYVKHYQYGTRYSEEGKKAKTADETHWDNVLSEYGWTHADEFDLQICHLLENGYILEKGMQAAVERLNGESIQAKKTGAFEGAWNLFHNTFASNEDELVNALEKYFVASAEWISPINVQGTVSLLRELGYGKVANALTEYWVSVQCHVNPDALDLANYPWANEIHDKYLREAIANAQRQNEGTPTLADTIKKIAMNQGWGPLDIQVLSAGTVDDYYEFFLGANDEKLGSYVRACLRFGNISGGGEDYNLVTKKTTEALQRIGRMNRLNAVRVQRYGIQIESTQPTAGEGNPTA